MSRTSYVAYGLALSSRFGLPAMASCRAGVGELPSLELALVAPDRLGALWSGAGAPPIWRGRLGDGSELTIEHGLAGDVLLTHAGRSWFHLSADGGSLTCARRWSGVEWQRVLLSRILPAVSVMRGYEALHASSVVSPWGAVAIAAPTGGGKTTLALELMSRGWPLLSDDVLTLSQGVEGPLAYPGTPHMNVAEESQPEVYREVLGSTLERHASERWVAVEETSRSPSRVCAIFLLDRGEGRPCEARRLPASPLALAPHMLGLAGPPERERRRFELYAELGASAMLFALSCRPDEKPADLARVIERAVAGPAPVLAGAATR